MSTSAGGGQVLHSPPMFPGISGETTHLGLEWGKGEICVKAALLF